MSLCILMFVWWGYAVSVVWLIWMTPQFEPLPLRYCILFVLVWKFMVIRGTDEVDKSKLKETIALEIMLPLFFMLYAWILYKLF